MGVFYFSTGNIEMGTSQADIHQLAISGDDQRLADLLREQPHLANATRENTGWTPLHGAVCNGNTQCVRLLIVAGADVNAQEVCNQFTPLHFAAEDGHTDIAEMLLMANAVPNLLDLRGKTPLDRAMWENHKEVALLLKKYGGKPSEEISGPQETSASD
jgi:ankyrin repeat protein